MTLCSVDVSQGGGWLLHSAYFLDVLFEEGASREMEIEAEVVKDHTSVGVKEQSAGAV
jgi:hypothetical protein